MPRQFSSTRALMGLSSIWAILKNSYSRTRLRRRKLSSWYFSLGRSPSRDEAKRGSFSKVEKMVFWKCRRPGTADLGAQHGTPVRSSSDRFSQGCWLR